MAELRIALNNIAPEGKTFVVDDPAVWSGPMKECGMDCRVVSPLVGTVTLFPQADGCLVRGNLKGEVVVPCNRCAEDAHLIIDSSFDSFEPFPNADDDAPEPAEAASFMLLKEQLVEVLKTLTPREEKVLRLRFGIEDGHTRTLEEVGKEFNVTRERIRQIEAKALRKLRHPSRSKKLKDFLN